MNTGYANGGRLAAAWKPTADFSLKLSALYQDSHRNGSPQVEPDLGDLEQDALPGTGQAEKKIQAYSATAAGRIAGIDIVSITGYSVSAASDPIDITSLYASLSQGQFGVPGTSDALLQPRGRFPGAAGHRAARPRVQWLFGGFYTHENSRNTVDILPEDATGTPVGVWFHNDEITRFQEYAAFTNLTVQITDRLDVQIGGRQSYDRQTYTGEQTGLLTGSDTPEIVPLEESTTSAFTYLLTPRFKISDNLMTYARLASGFRPGGPNTGIVAQGVPSQYDPDKTENYEIGVKGNFLDRLLSFDASVYYIDCATFNCTCSTRPPAAAIRRTAAAPRARGWSCRSSRFPSGDWPSPDGCP